MATSDKGIWVKQERIGGTAPARAASGISGVTLITDAGYMMSGITESFPSATMMARVLMGRS